MSEAEMSRGASESSSANPDRPIWNWLRGPQEGAAGPGWLHWHPAQIERCIAERADQLPTPLNEQELEELRAAHRGWGADESSSRAISALGTNRARVIVAGQQPGLLAGPLLVLYKALCAIKLARQLGEKHPELTFVPVFWVASEDHDLNEIKRVYWAGQTGQLEESLYVSEGVAPGRMIGGLPTTKYCGQLLQHIGQTMRASDFSESVHDLLKAAYAGHDATIESGFARIMLRLLRGRGLVLVTPRMQWLIRRAQPIVARELAAPGESTRRVIARGEELKAQGQAPALHRPSGSVNLFYVAEGDERETLRLTEEDAEQIAHCPVGSTEPREHSTAESLRQLAEASPERFSTNVVTRPLVQDTALPTVAQIVGPGEATYLAQVEAVYESFGAFRPVRWPRPQVVLIEPRVARQLEKYGLTVAEALQNSGERLGDVIVRRNLEQGGLDVLQRTHMRQREEIEQLQTQLNSSDGARESARADPAIERAFEKLLQALDKGYGTIQERLLYQRKRDEGNLVQAMATIGNSLRPVGHDQERALNPLVPFALHFGLDWVEALERELPMGGEAEPLEFRLPGGGTEQS